MCYIDAEPCELWNETKVKARKRHRCSVCQSDINAGVVYLKHFSKFEGEISHGKICPACEADRAMFAAAHDGVSTSPEGFAWLLSDCIADGDEESETKWKPMLARIRARHQSATAKGTP